MYRNTGSNPTGLELEASNFDRCSYRP